MKSEIESTVKVSIIVPVWNPGPGFSRCIDSLTGQTLKDIEIIFIDDCGTDEAMTIVKEKAANDNRIRIIKNARNIGPGMSRNVGISEAHGEYFSFIDADDFVEKDFLELLYDKATTHNADISKGTYDVYYENGSNCIFLPVRRDNIKIQESIVNRTPLMESFYSKHFTAIYRSCLFANSDIRFGDMVVSEDAYFLLQLCRFTDSIVLEEKARYHYTTTETSISSEMSETRLLEYANSFRILLKTLMEKYVPDQSAQNYAATRIQFMLFLHFWSGFIPDMSTARNQFLSEIRKTVTELPFIGNLVEEYPEIKVFMECDAVLPLRYSSSSKIILNELFYATSLIKQWVDFFIQHPGYEIVCEERFRNILRKKPVIFTKELEQKHVWPLFFYPCIQKELHRLPLRYYLLISGPLLVDMAHRMLLRIQKRIAYPIRHLLTH